LAGFFIRRTREGWKPGGSRPVSRVLSGTVIHLGQASPPASSDLPGDTRGPRAAARSRLPPYLVLLRVGFTLPPTLPLARCALTTPFHPYRSALADRRYLFCGTCRGLAPPRCYLAPCPMEPGLSSPRTAKGGRAATVWPTPIYSIARKPACSGWAAVLTRPLGHTSGIRKWTFSEL